ncbi:glycoside hydrolase family 25 protein [Streptomyces sp. NPDC102462]|uniref:glycoside hydrolase family 25 protein n=1 Tax=Streptomyces sp. NPDC102462 TaxID=3366178 RepID=UPI00382E3D7D
MATCRGMDVSAYQGTQNWAAHKGDGVVFAFAKASEGRRSRDAKFDSHITGIIKAGLVPGAYHFAWPNQDVDEEAANYIGAVRAHAKKGFTHWLDLERYADGRNYSGRSAAQIKSWAAAWIAAVRAAFPGQRVGVYTSGDDLAAGRVPDGVPLWYPAYPWGAASYSRAEAAARPRPSGRAPLIWQFTSLPVDRSIAYLSEAGLRAWAAGDTSEEDEMPQYVNLGLAKPYKLSPGAWDSIEFTKEWSDETGDHATDGSVWARGPARFTGSVSLYLTGLPAGAVVQARMSEYQGDKHEADHPIHEIIGTAGGTFAVIPLTKRLAKGRGMRVRLLNQSGSPVTVSSAVLTLLVWKES